MAFLKANIDASTLGDNIVIDANAAGDWGTLYGLTLTGAGAVKAIVKDQAGTVLATFQLAAGTMARLSPPPNGGDWGRFNGDLIINLSGATAVGGCAIYSIDSMA